LSESHEALERMQELLERLRGRVDALETLAADGGDVDAAIETLAEVAELAKQAEAEILRVRQAADAGA
jgi:uncharacterized protein YoxC